MRFTLLTLSFLSILSSSFAVPQIDPPKSSVYETLRKQGKKLYEKADYRNASLMYQRYYKKHPDQQVAGVLADCYWNMGWYDSAMVFLQKADQSNVRIKERQAEILARKGNYIGASEIYNSLINSADAKTKELYNLRKSGYDNLSSFMRDSSDWKLSYLSLNTGVHETAPVLWKKNLFLVSNRTNGYAYPTGKTVQPESFHFVHNAGSIKNLNLRTVDTSAYFYYDYNRAYNSDITVRTSNDSKALLPGIVKKKMPFSGTTIEKFNLMGAVGRVSFTADGKEVYYSRLTQNKQGNTILELCKSVLEYGVWSKAEVLSVNNDSISSFHPFISEDGKALYFSSDRPGGKGGIDIYRTNLSEDGKWSAAENLVSVNTPNDEVYPSLFNDHFYFSSNGWPGMGGFDIFGNSTARNDMPVNLGYPVNSSADDYSIVFADSSKGFMASNRYGSDDVFQVHYHDSYLPLKSFVISEKTGLRQKDVTVILEQKQADGSWKKIAASVTDQNGVYSFSVKPNRDDYRVIVTAEGYKDIIQTVDTKESAAETAVVLVSKNNSAPVDLTHSSAVNNKMPENPNEVSIHHHFDKTDIVEEDQGKIEQIVARMQGNMGLQLEIISAADCYGDKQYNLNLSKKRATYILGLLPASLRDRIQLKWVGQDSPVDPCDEAVLSIQGQENNRYTLLRIK